jgi:tetratricopeptide (TPR) repeat protein
VERRPRRQWQGRGFAGSVPDEFALDKAVTRLNRALRTQFRPLGAFALSRIGKGAPASAQLSSPIAEAKFQQGWALQQQGKFADAERIYEDILRLQPNHPGALTLLGAVCLQTGRTDRGIALIRKALEIDPNAAQPHFYLGNGLKDLSRYEEALASFDKSIALRPDVPDSHFARATTLYLMKRSEAAVPSFDRAIALRPDFAVAHNNRGIALADLKRFKDAICAGLWQPGRGAERTWPVQRGAGQS